MTANLPDSDDQPVGGLRARELISPCVELLRFTAQVDGLANERARQPRIGIGLSNFVGFAAGESCDSERVGEPKSLVDFRIDPKLGALPQPHAGIKRGVPGLAALSAAGQTVGALIGRPECGIGLLEERGLTVEVNVIWVRRRGCLQNHWRRCRGAAELIVQAGAQLLHREIGIDPLRPADKSDACGAVIGVQIF